MSMPELQTAGYQDSRSGTVYGAVRSGR